MTIKMGVVANKLIGSGMLLLSAIFLSPYTTDGKSVVGVAFGLAGLWLVARREPAVEVSARELSDRIAKLEGLVESQADELERAKGELARLGDERGFMAQLSTSASTADGRERVARNQG